MWYCPECERKYHAIREMIECPRCHIYVEEYSGKLKIIRKSAQLFLMMLIGGLGWIFLVTAGRGLLTTFFPFLPSSAEVGTDGLLYYFGFAAGAIHGIIMVMRDSGASIIGRPGESLLKRRGREGYFGGPANADDGGLFDGGDGGDGGGDGGGP